MTTFFLESSALVKRYVQEIGTAWMQGLTASATGSSLYIAQITGVETVAAIALRMRRGNTTAQDAVTAIADFRHDFLRDYTPIQITLDVILLGMDLTTRHGLRGYDAVQLAAALNLQAECDALGLARITFLCADNELNAAARAEGLTVDNPNAHP